MTNQEAIKEAEIQIMVYENMILYNKDFEPKNDNSNYEHKLEFLKIAKEALEMAEQYKLALFGVIRNSKVMPAGMRLGKNMQEINKMSVETMHKVIEMCDFERLREFYKEGEQE